MKTTGLFALLVALLARQPTVHEPGPNEPGAAKPDVQQPAPGALVKPAKPEEIAAKEALSRAKVKAVEPAPKD